MFHMDTVFLGPFSFHNIDDFLRSHQCCQAGARGCMHDQSSIWLEYYLLPVVTSSHPEKQNGKINKI